MTHFPSPCLMLVTDSSLRPGAALKEAVAAAVDGGADAVQVREKGMPSGELLQLAQRLRAITAGKALLIINDRADIAVACDADGVHLAEDGMSSKVARLVAGRDILVGRSAHSLESALEAERAGAEYIVFGTVYPSRSHPDGPVSGPSLLREVCSRVSAPVLAIGGVTKDNISEVMDSGAAGVAVISAILAADDPRSAAQALKKELERCWSSKALLKPS